MESFFDGQQNLRQRLRVYFGRSARARGKRRETNWGVGNHDFNNTLLFTLMMSKSAVLGDKTDSKWFVECMG